MSDTNEDAPRAGVVLELSAAAQRMWLSDLSIRQPVFITMIVVAVMVVGMLFYSRMGLDFFPDISLPIVVVRTAYPGANPQEVERFITKPIEDVLAPLNGVRTVRSTTMDSISLVTIEFDMSKNSKEAADDVRTSISGLRNSLPTEAKEPAVLRFDPSAAPILSLAIIDTADRRSPEDLRTLADEVLKTRLEQIPGVGAVELTGGRMREVHVDLQAARLEAYGIPPQQVVQAIRSENLDLPTGRISDGRREESLRTAGEVRSLAQLGEIPVASWSGGAAVRVKDVASLSEGYTEVRATSRFDGRESVVADVRKQSGTNTVQVADAVKRELSKLQREYPDLDVGVALDQSTFTREAVQDVQLSLVLGAVLAALVVLLFFRDLRNTLVTVAGLPMILLGTFAVLYVLGITLNMISMMALSLSVGMLIDDAIVVRENILRHMEGGEGPKAAAGRGTAEIALAVIAVSSTIVAVFLPVAFTGGIAGKLLRDFGVTVAVAVVISLLEAFTLAPMLSAYFFQRIDPAHHARVRSGRFGRLFEGLGSGYHGVLRWSLRHRLVVVVVAFLAFASSLAVVPRMVFSFAPETDQGIFGIGLELPAGARLAETDRLARTMERLLQDDPAVAHVFTAVGSSDGAVERASINVGLRERGHTDEAIARLRPQLEQAISTNTGAKLTADRQSATGMLGTGAAVGAIRGRPVQFSIQGEDFKLLDEVSTDLLAHLQQVPGTIDLDRSSREGKPARAIVIDRGKATDLGVTTAQVGTTMRALINGERTSTYRAGGKDIDIIVRLAEADRSNPVDILRLPVVNSRGDQVRLSAIASLVESTEPQQISRENRQRQVIVGGGYVGRSQGAVVADARAAAAAMSLPPGVTISVAGQARYTDEMAASLGLALGLTVLFVYMILASQFGSFAHPITIMLALPFSAIGALLALFLAGLGLDMLGMMGIILLMGLVTKNSILLVEFTNQLRRRGLGVREAILHAGPVRLRPIVMTTLAMILGMLPTALGLGAGSELRRSMGLGVIGGLVTSTLLTLVVVPVAYSLVADLSRLVAGRGHVEATSEKLRDAEPAPSC